MIINVRNNYRKILLSLVITMFLCTYLHHSLKYLEVLSAFKYNYLYLIKQSPHDHLCLENSFNDKKQFMQKQPWTVCFLRFGALNSAREQFCVNQSKIKRRGQRVNIAEIFTSSSSEGSKSFLILHVFWCWRSFL